MHQRGIGDSDTYRFECFAAAGSGLQWRIGACCVESKQAEFFAPKSPKLPIVINVIFDNVDYVFESFISNQVSVGIVNPFKEINI